MAATMSGRVAAMHCPRAWRLVSVLTVQKRLEDKGRDDRGFIFLSPSLTTLVAEAFFPFLFLLSLPGLELAACS